MLNNQDFMELGWRNDVGLLDVKGQGISEREKSDEDRLINGLKWSYDYVDHDHADIHVQIVPEIHQEEENSKKDLTLVVPDEHSETGDHHHLSKDRSDNRCYLRNKREKPKRRRIQIFSDDESEGFTREVPSVTGKGDVSSGNESLYSSGDIKLRNA
ncbi:unnamed protein product [Thlaspi arvense]|uniref:Uncharacterized protein n=1 Tax=Thlaspi arvense TaxID=13288 RepID=A0AAU9RF88_THLAR|nr:unnamed protein product [Thlaspi arvense]